MRGILAGGVLSALMVIGLASAQGAEGVQFSGGVYHKAVCGRVVGMAAACQSRIVTDSKGVPLGTSRGERISGYAPADLRDAYKITATGSSSTIIAIVDAFGYDNAEADLQVYRTQWGLPTCTTANGCFKKLNQRGHQRNYPAQNIGWAQESALDVDMASAMCPNCQIWLVEADNNSLKNLAKAVKKAADLGAHVISNSYGGGEGKKTLIYDSYYTHPGIAVTASSGDGGFGVIYPSSSPHVTAVGGTRLTHASNDRGWTETAWTGAGSGCSRTHAKPEWQTDTGCKHRTVADVSAVADPATGVAVYGPNGSGNSQWLRFGGTSVSAPLIGGIYGANGGTVNYGSDPYAHTDALFDVVAGSNGDCAFGTLGVRKYLCNAGPGYDGPTGLGTPNGITAFGEP
jgi:subtilase family serine protease